MSSSVDSVILTSIYSLLNTAQSFGIDLPLPPAFEDFGPEECKIVLSRLRVLIDALSEFLEVSKYKN